MKTWRGKKKRVWGAGESGSQAYVAGGRGRGRGGRGRGRGDLGGGCRRGGQRKKEWERSVNGNVEPDRGNPSPN